MKYGHELIPNFANGISDDVCDDQDAAGKQARVFVPLCGKVSSDNTCLF